MFIPNTLQSLYVLYAGILLARNSLLSLIGTKRCKILIFIILVILKRRNAYLAVIVK